MKVGIVREQRSQEYRVAMTPGGVHELVRYGHQVLVERDAGAQCYYSDEDYEHAGAVLAERAEDVWEQAQLMVKVTRPAEHEWPLMHEGQILFTFLHLSGQPALAQHLMDTGVTGIAFELVQTPERVLPLLRPMSEIAGRLAPQVGATQLMHANGGRGVLMGGVPGVAPAKVVVIGAGNAGFNAAKIASGMHADVSIVDADVERLRYIDNIYQGAVSTHLASALTIERLCLHADLVIGAVLVSGSVAPKVVSNDLVRAMKKGSVLVDVAIDQGGCFEDSRPTTHANPTIRVHDSLFYCVTNMPSGVARTATRALGNATQHYILSLANNGWQEAVRADRTLAAGLVTAGGRLTHQKVGEHLGLDYVDVDAVL